MQRTKYDYVVASLSPEFAAEVSDLILNVPDRPYDTLKRVLIERTCPPQQRRLQQLLHATELGDRKPSQLLRHMRQLLGDTDRPLLREPFHPATVCMVLASNATDTSLDDMAQLTDRIIDVAPSTVAALSSASPAQDEVKALRTKIDRLKELVTSLVSRPRSHQPSPFPRRSRPPTPPPPSPSCARTTPVLGREPGSVYTPPCAQAGNAQAGC